MTDLDKEVEKMADAIVASTPAAPVVAAAPLRWPAFTCVSCGDIYPATSFKVGPDGPAPQLRGHFTLPKPHEDRCVCQACIRAHYRMLQNGELG